MSSENVDNYNSNNKREQILSQINFLLSFFILFLL